MESLSSVSMNLLSTSEWEGAVPRGRGEASMFWLSRPSIGGYMFRYSTSSDCGCNSSRAGGIGRRGRGKLVTDDLNLHVVHH